MKSKFLILFLVFFASYVFAGEVTITPITYHINDKGDFAGYCIQHTDEPANKLIIFMKDTKTFFTETSGDIISWHFLCDPAQMIGFLPTDPEIIKGHKFPLSTMIREVDTSRLKSFSHLILSFNGHFKILVKIVKGKIVDVSEFKSDLMDQAAWPRDYDAHVDLIQ